MARRSRTVSPLKTNPFDLSLPKVPKWLTMLQGWINDLSIADLRYITPGSEPVRVNKLSAKVLWYRGILYVNELNAKTSFGTARGAVMIDLARPALRAQLKATLQKAAAGIDTVSLDARLPSSKGEEQIAGPVVIDATAGKQERFKA